MSREGRPPNQTACPLEVSPQSCGPTERKMLMHREDLMSADMLSEILLLVSGFVILVTLLLIGVTALTQTAALV
jgi:hypothetical protein